MKPTNTKNQKELKLLRRLEVVRTTIRELSPSQLGDVNGGSAIAYTVEWPPACSNIYTVDSQAA